jgi:hypothetical protein
LAFYYQEDGDDVLAAAAYERARQVVRINYGFSTFREVPLLRQLAHIEDARGNDQAAWDIEQDMLALIRQHADDARVAPILHELADKRMDVYRQYRDGRFPPQIVIGCYYRADRNDSCTAGSRGVVLRAIAREAQTYRAMAIEALVRNGLYASEELRELETEALRFGGIYRCPGMALQELLTMEIVDSCLDPVMDESEGRPVYNLGGAASLVRLLIYEIRSEAPALSQVNALIRLADSQLAFSRTGESALGLYELAFRHLEASDVAQTAIDEIFSPQTPVLLATYSRGLRIDSFASGTNPLETEQSPDTTGYIDVVFHVTEHGDGERVQILESTTNATRAAERDLVRLIERSRFRPRASEGRLVETDRVALRYYVD